MTELQNDLISTAMKILKDNDLSTDDLIRILGFIGCRIVERQRAASAKGEARAAAVAGGRP